MKNLTTKGIFLHLFFKDGTSVRLPLQAPIHGSAGDNIRIGSKRWLKETLFLYGAARVELRRFGRILAATGTVEPAKPTPTVQVPPKPARTVLAKWKPIVSTVAHYEHG